MIPLNRYHTHEEIVRRKKRVQKQVSPGSLVTTAVKMETMISGDGGKYYSTYKGIAAGSSSTGCSNRINIHSIRQTADNSQEMSVTMAQAVEVNESSNGANLSTAGIDVTPLGMHLKYEEIVADVTEIVEPSNIVIAKK